MRIFVFALVIGSIGSSCLIGATAKTIRKADPAIDFQNAEKAVARKKADADNLENAAA